jgi:ATP-binding protein involved in chromosome partitioning
MPVTENQILDALRAVRDPERGGDIVSLGMVSGVVIRDGNVGFAIEVEAARGPHLEPLRKAAEHAVEALPDVLSVTAVLTAEARPPGGARAGAAPPAAAQPAPAAARAALAPGVRAIVAVASGKGGVGKSTVSVNLAVALAQAGASVGLLDGDITGPNIPLMLGLEGQPRASANNKITPLERYGVKAISIQFFVPEGQPIVWRGPLVGGAIQQFLRDVDWGELDYLVIDLPPGTSDAQLTLAQAVPISGAVLVTTPQEVSLADVGKALAMFQRMSVPVIGLVENMTAFVCPHCDEVTEIFGRGGGERFAAAHDLEYLGGIPLDITVRQGGDVGVPAVAQREPGPAGRAMTAIAQVIAARMSVRAAQAAAQPVLTIS